MEIGCAGCECIVSSGVRTTACDDAQCCCAHLPLRPEPSRVEVPSSSRWPLLDHVERVWRWLTASAPASADPEAVVAVPIGGGPFDAELAAAACRAAGIEVELLVSEMGQHPASAGVEQQLLVRAADVDAVRSVLDRRPDPPPTADV